MKFQEFAELCGNLEQCAGTELRERIAAYYTVTDCVKEFTYLLLGNIDAQFKDNVIGLADKTVLKIIGQTYGTQKGGDLYKTLGDVGLVAQDLHKNKPVGLLPPKPVSVQDLYAHLHKLKDVSGAGSVQQKASMVQSMLANMNAVEAKYYTRILTGTLRLGVGIMAIIDALSISVHGDKRDKKRIEHAYNVYPDLGDIAAEYLSTKTVTKHVTIGVPVRVMLAQRVKVLHEIEERITFPMYADTKYDGERVQIHVNDTVTLFSRRMENITEQFPDIVRMCQGLPPCILEGEIMACNQSGDLLHFTDLMQRKRKHDINEVAKKVPVRVFCFDVIFCETSQIETPYTERMQLLDRLIAMCQLERSVCHNVDSIDALETVFNDTVKEHEGLIIKDAQGLYVPGNRNFAWIKWKADYGQIDSFDLVIVGADHGKGKRSGTYGSFMLACKDGDEFVTVTKLGSGMTDEQLKQVSEQVEVAQQPKAVFGSITCDVFLEPTIVVEVIAAEISKGSGHSGVALRFPRMICVRTDKAVDDVTTREEIESMR